MSDPKSTEEKNGPETLHWREAIKADLAEKAKTGPLFGNDENGNACRFDPDGTVTVLRTAEEVRKADAAILSNET